MNKPFNLEAFKAGQKAYLIEGKCFRYVFTTSEGRICVEYETVLPLCDKVQVYHLETLKKAHMVSCHQHLIDSYNPEDTWQLKSNSGIWCNMDLDPLWTEERDYHLHPHNDLIKAWKKGAKIEMSSDGIEWEDSEEPAWNEEWHYRIKPESEFTYPIYKQIADIGLVVKYSMWQDWTPPTIHCLCYNPGHVYGEMTWTPCLATKETAIANGWHIIQEWEV